jgi:putative SOS response-associated peptidase YedK
MRRFAQAIAEPDSVPAGVPHALGAALAAAPDRYNIGKASPAAVLARDADGTLGVATMHWGLVPRWSKAPSTPYTTVTARLDRAPGSRIFAKAWRERPCVVPMSGYYKLDRQRRPHWPLFVQRRDGVALLAAGLWEHWEDGEGQVLDTFSVLTAPNPAIPAPLTADGPVFLSAALAMEWLSGAITSPDALRVASPALEAYPVGRAFRDLTRDDYTLLEPVDPDLETASPPPLDEDGDVWDDEE